MSAAPPGILRRRRSTQSAAEVRSRPLRSALPTLARPRAGCRPRQQVNWPASAGHCGWRRPAAEAGDSRRITGSSKALKVAADGSRRLNRRGTNKCVVCVVHTLQKSYTRSRKCGCTASGSSIWSPAVLEKQDIRRIMPVPLTGELGTAIVDHADPGARRYRYHLTRDLGQGRGHVAFVMLNPSRANHNCNDDTVERCIELARGCGYRVLEVGNLYALYATVPADLRVCLDCNDDPIGQHNDEHLDQIAAHCDKVVAAWGGQGKVLGRQRFRNRANCVLQCLWDAMVNSGRTPSIYRLGTLTAHGHPRHPLQHGPAFQPSDLVRWDNGTPPQV